MRFNNPIFSKFNNRFGRCYSYFKKDTNRNTDLNLNTTFKIGIIGECSKEFLINYKKLLESQIQLIEEEINNLPEKTQQ